ncbi:MAG: hypothetical protein PHT77_10300 [Bacteroidales bacterium]|nr:hypothetical protein [Bacteroidales bacterium]
MNVPKIRLNLVHKTLLLGILASVIVFFTVKEVWAEDSLFIQVRSTMILLIFLGVFFMVASIFMFYHKSTVVLHRDGKFTHAAVKLSSFEIPYKKGGRSALLPFWIIKHDGFNAYIQNFPGKGERGGIEIVPHVPDKDKTRYGAMIQEMGDNLIIHSEDRKAHIGLEEHNKLGVIWDEIIKHGNTTGCKYGEDTIVFMHTIPGSRAVVPEKVLDRLMELNEVNAIHGEIQAQERMKSSRLQEEIESKNIRTGDAQIKKNVDHVRDPNMETEQ